MISLEDVQRAPKQFTHPASDFVDQCQHTDGLDSSNRNTDLPDVTNFSGRRELQKYVCRYPIV